MKPFAVAAVEGGGVLVHLTSGAVLGLNPSATTACEALERGDDPVAALCERHDVDRPRAANDVAAILAELEAVSEPAATDSFLRRTATGHRLEMEGSVLEIDRSGETLRWIGTPGGDAIVRAAIPHALALMGMTLLHASAAFVDGGAIAFVGASGAGKSTIAAALSAHPLADDLLGIAEAGAIAIEDRVAEWIRSRSLDAARLKAVWTHEPLPLRAVHLIARDRPSAIQSRRLGAVEAVEKLLFNAFAEANEPRVWRDALRLSARLASSVPIFETAITLHVDSVHALAHDWTR